MTSNKLQNELKKKKPFDSVEHEAVLNVLRTGDQIQNCLGKLFREYGLTSSQYNVLRILRGVGRPMPSLEIASQMIQVVPAITGLIDRLEKQGLVSRRRCKDDRRVVYIEATKKALDILSKMDEPFAELHSRLVGHMSKSELRELSRLLEKARAQVGIAFESKALKTKA